MSEYQKLQAQIAQLQRKSDELFAVDRQVAISTVLQLVADFRLSAKDLGLSGGGKAAGDSSPVGARGTGKRLTVKVPVKYRDTAGNGWTGRGIQPKWLRAALAAGQTLESFLVKG